ncbi:hypothetical protein ATANTOWER_013335 [Ataeniobius toweri]|uniref:Uncharacterized protein n=1 Tax=Ataeniobius toweri TaxID=208326 RepID=A0ABU7ANZ8_9TELE|nr:hypothetical protein [Ataeniobius toweri]
MDEPPPHPDPVSGPVPEGFLDEPPPQPDPVPSSVPEGSQTSHPHTLFLSVRGSWMDCLHFLLLFLVLSWRAPRRNCLHPWFLFRRSSWRTCLHFLFLSLRSGRTHPLCMLGLAGSAAYLHGLAEGPSGLCTDRLASSGFHASELHRGFSWSRRRASDHRLLRRRPADHLKTSSEVQDHKRSHETQCQTLFNHPSIHPSSMPTYHCQGFKGAGVYPLWSVGESWETS